MNLRITISLFLLISMAAFLDAQEDYPPAPAADSRSTGTGEPTLPKSDADTGDPASDLLPASGELPAEPPKPSRGETKQTQSAAQFAKDEGGHFEEVRQRAMESPRAVYLLKRARSTSHRSSRRTYLREYYAALAERMRKLDPELRTSINAFEEAKIQSIEGSEVHTATKHRSEEHHSTRYGLHHPSHRTPVHHHRRRAFIDDRSPYPWDASSGDFW